MQKQGCQQGCGLTFLGCLLQATHFDVTILALRQGPPSAEEKEGDPTLPGPPAPQKPIPPAICRCAQQELQTDEQ